VVRRDATLAMLGQVPLFEHCSERELSAIVELMTEVDIPSGGQLTAEGDWGHEFYVLVEGSAEVRRKGRLLNTLGPGDFLGELMLVADRPRTATVTATAATHLLVVSGGDFRRLMREDAAFQTKVLDAVAERLPGSYEIDVPSRRPSH